MIRLVPNQAKVIERAPEVTFRFDGAAIRGCPGESVVAALMRAGVRHLRDAPNGAAPRGAFCLMGLCQECMVRIDGEVVEACRVLVHDGLEVTRL